MPQLGMTAGGFDQGLGQLFGCNTGLRGTQQGDEYARALSELGIEEFFDLVAGIVIANPAHRQRASQQQAQHPDQDAFAD